MRDQEEVIRESAGEATGVSGTKGQAPLQEYADSAAETGAGDPSVDAGREPGVAASEQGSQEGGAESGAAEDESGDSSRGAAGDGTRHAPDGPILGYDLHGPSDESVELCARICHEVVRSMNEVYGEVTMSWEASREAVIGGILFTLANPQATNEDQHNEWWRHKVAEGWKYGPEKDATKKTHPCMIAYKMLDKRQRSKDAMFVAIVKTFFGR